VERARMGAGLPRGPDLEAGLAVRPLECGEVRPAAGAHPLVALEAAHGARHAPRTGAGPR